MAKAKKTKNTIQATVDTYAAARDKEQKLHEAIRKAVGMKLEAQATLISHVKATSKLAVAYQAANGDTLVVHPGDYSAHINVVKPGAQTLPEAPKPATAAIADSVASLLAKGEVNEAQKRINEALAKSLSAGQTATDAHNAQMAEGVRVHNVLDDMVRHVWKRNNLAEMYGTGRLFRFDFAPARLYRHGQEVCPAIEQQVYKSATMGPIKLSQYAKGLLLVNRDAIQTAIGRGNYNASGMAVSASRGKIAQYMSELEQRVNSLTDELRLVREGKVA